MALLFLELATNSSPSCSSAYLASIAWSARLKLIVAVKSNFMENIPVKGIFLNIEQN